MRLQLAHLVPAEHVLITGDFNVHLGTLSCGVPPEEDDTSGQTVACAWMDSADELPAVPNLPVGVRVSQSMRGACPVPVGGRHVSSRTPWRYLRRRFSSCTATGALPQGRAFDRACTRHAWLLLNGRCRSDASGHPTYFHQGGCSVLDLAIVLPSAAADMRVL